MENIFHLISQVPNVVWSAVIASFLTFLGVMWTNKGNERRQIALLEYEKEKYKSEQKLALKKEVFLNVASSFANVLGVFPKLMNLKITEKEISDQVGDHSGIVAKSYLVAKEESVAEILNFSSETAEVYLDLAKERHVLLDHQSAIEIYQTMINKANEEKNRILSMMQEYNLQGRTDTQSFNLMDENYKFQEKIVNESTANIEKQKLELKPLHMSFAQKCIKEHSRMQSLLPPMTIALRAELENNDKSDIFIKALNENITRMNIAFTKLFEHNEN